MSQKFKFPNSVLFVILPFSVDVQVPFSLYSWVFLVFFVHLQSVSTDNKYLVNSFSKSNLLTLCNDILFIYCFICSLSTCWKFLISVGLFFLNCWNYKLFYYQLHVSGTERWSVIPEPELCFSSFAPPFPQEPVAQTVVSFFSTSHVGFQWKGGDTETHPEALLTNHHCLLDLNT